MLLGLAAAVPLCSDALTRQDCSSLLAMNMTCNWQKEHSRAGCVDDALACSWCGYGCAAFGACPRCEGIGNATQCQRSAYQCEWCNATCHGPGMCAWACVGAASQEQCSSAWSGCTWCSSPKRCQSSSQCPGSQAPELRKFFGWLVLLIILPGTLIMGLLVAIAVVLWQRARRKARRAEENTNSGSETAAAEAAAAPKWGVSFEDDDGSTDELIDAAAAVGADQPPRPPGVELRMRVPCEAVLVAFPPDYLVMEDASASPASSSSSSAAAAAAAAAASATAPQAAAPSSLAGPQRPRALSQQKVK
eukprot:m51a1_g9979 hypothetical protein (305) ;mRNA; f:9803-11084